MGNSWNDFKKNFPWKAMIIGFLIPKGIFFIGISHNMLFGGALLAVAWCVAVSIMAGFRDRKINIFAILTVVLILLRVIVVLASKSPALYLIAQALDSTLYGIVFLGSLCFPTSLIQLFAEASGVVMPDEIRSSPYYRKAWRIITAVWGAVFMLLAAALATLKLGDLGSAAIVDMIAGWPITAALIAFTVIFPRWYWAKKIGLSAVQNI